MAPAAPSQRPSPFYVLSLTPAGTAPRPCHSQFSSSLRPSPEPLSADRRPLASVHGMLNLAPTHSNLPGQAIVPRVGYVLGPLRITRRTCIHPRRNALCIRCYSTPAHTFSACAAASRALCIAHRLRYSHSPIPGECAPPRPPTRILCSAGAVVPATFPGCPTALSLSAAHEHTSIRACSRIGV
ncbi:hypothetical protein OH77DRAFT_1418668 [Trametes cingulata]|nr:hypothetical protein OH77DRAFT_1418668 [Trametes cingulata]